jgi:hypothetical protein
MDPRGEQRRPHHMEMEMEIHAQEVTQRGKGSGTGTASTTKRSTRWPWASQQLSATCSGTVKVRPRLVELQAAPASLAYFLFTWAPFLFPLSTSYRATAGMWSQKTGFTCFHWLCERREWLHLLPVALWDVERGERKRAHVNSECVREVRAGGSPTKRGLNRRCSVRRCDGEWWLWSSAADWQAAAGEDGDATHQARGAVSLPQACAAVPGGSWSYGGRGNCGLDWYLWLMVFVADKPTYIVLLWEKNTVP